MEERKRLRQGVPDNGCVHFPGNRQPAQGHNNEYGELEDQD